MENSFETNTVSSILSEMVSRYVLGFYSSLQLWIKPVAEKTTGLQSVQWRNFSRVISIIEECRLFLRSVRRLLVTANVVPSSPILVTLMMEALRSPETSVLIGATRRNTPEDGILHSYRRENLKSYTALTGWTLQRRRNVSPVRYELGFYIPENGILHSHCRENLKSYIFRIVGQIP
jgi:hypothetical protein